MARRVTLTTSAGVDVAGAARAVPDADALSPGTLVIVAPGLEEPRSLGRALLILVPAAYGLAAVCYSLGLLTFRDELADEA